ncbi:hypothetical protein OHC33_000714 [Knufia fluminis]|uniref:Short-chain dehydrogenase n=1 Tax=Knufia fluminis TaxID=191047 RepID=A0AAN8EQU2_9EURO|nr:hypothetical protein OHC33_000714 [Knufia fluminis]
MSRPQQSISFDRYANTFKHPQGPGDARPTALQIIKDEDLEGQLSDKIVLITGGSSGIGIETARALAHTGAKIVLGVRDVPKAKAVLEDILKDKSIGESPLEIIEMDLNFLDSVRKAAEAFLDKRNKLNILINNAGIGGVVEGRTSDGFESHFGVNHLAHFLLFQLLKDTLIASSTPTFQSRVIAVGSLIHRLSPTLLSDPNFGSTPYDPALAYASSKTANTWFANHLERLYANKGIHAISLHPGAINSGLQRFHAPEYQEMMQKAIPEEDMPGLMKTFKSLEQGAATTVLAAVGRAFEGEGGIYLDDCQVAPLYDPKDKIYAPGYAAHAFDEAGEEKLWQMSLKMVGLGK